MDRRTKAANKHGDITDWLSTFKIEVSSSNPLLYGNSLQQVEVTLTVEAVGEEIITEEQLKSLTLVYLDTDGSYIPLPDQMTESFEWFASLTHDERFGYYEGSGRTEVTSSLPSSASRAELTKKFYVSTVALGGSEITLRARITKTEGEQYVTEDTFDSSVDLSSVSVPTYSFPDDYNWAITWQDGGPPANAFVQEWSLTAKHAVLVYAEARDGNPDGMIKWHRNAVGESAASNVGVAYPGDKNFRFNPAIEVGADFSQRRHEEVKSTKSHQVVVVLQADNAIPYNAEGLMHQGPCRVLAFDKNGNSHELEFSFGTGSAYEQRTTLQVNVYSPAHTGHRSVKTSDGAVKK
ncbi:hypothetical protein [Pseudomonas sp. NFR16]|uniref:hypothetical protein n=1 Tax=Pseudomonas sp. NFR16 TaxID=1566248 RepID=UPI0008B222DC|nr:hypothetical protein [Pseudomonas sp. NFR16]SEJ13228.1 hypothetical protein SAMN03159495_2429 [Pseudomonas sp. NFR16]